MFDQVKFVVIVVCFVLIAAFSYFMFSYIKNIGFQQANAACVARFDKYQEDIDKKLADVQTSVSQTAEGMITSNQLLQDDLRKIGFRVSKIPTTIVVDGKCVPNPEAIKDVNEAIKRVNAELSKK